MDKQNGQDTELKYKIVTKSVIAANLTKESRSSG
jgi:hypothetical protein